MDEVTLNAAEMVLAQRAFLYGYLSRAFAGEPDEAFLAAVADPGTVETCGLLDGEEGPCRDAAERLAALASEALAGDGGLDTLRSVYTRLFLGPASLPVPPWESVFLSREPVLFQESMLAVRKAYRAAGFRAAGYPHEADDHLAIELSFMEALAQRTCELLRSDPGDADAARALCSAQDGFLRDHLLVWVGEFADRLGDEAGEGSFYGLFARLAALTCTRDADILGEIEVAWS